MNMEDNNQSESKVQDIDECYSDENLDSELLVQKFDKFTNLEVFEFKDVMHYIEQQIDEIKELLNLNADNAYEILIYYNWNINNLTNQFQDNILEQLYKQGIFNNHSTVCYQVDSSSCPICQKIDNKLVKLGCGHLICDVCIQKNIFNIFIKEEQILIPCQQHNCNYRLPISMIQNFTNVDDFSRIICERFIESNNTFVYCKRDDCKKILRAKDSSSTTITCTCGALICCKCNNESHFPLPCDIAKNWVTKITQDESMIKWIKLNTKACFLCKKIVIKSAQPIPLRFIFRKDLCEACCVPLYQDSKDLEEQKTLFRYRFYYQKFLDSKDDIKQIEFQLSQVNEKCCQELQGIYKVTSLETEFFEDAYKELIKSKQVLKWNYCLGNLISNTNPTSSEIFDNYLQDFELSCKELGIQCNKLLKELERLDQIPLEMENSSLDARQADFQSRKKLIQNLYFKCKLQRENLFERSKDQLLNNCLYSI